MLVLDEEQTRAALALAGADRGDRARCLPAAASCLYGITTIWRCPARADAHAAADAGLAAGALYGREDGLGFPGQCRRARCRAIFGTYLLSSGKTGEMLATIDGGELTARRTAAASALAARYLARAGRARSCWSAAPGGCRST